MATHVKFGGSPSRFLGNHLITKNAHIPPSSTKKYFHGHTLFSRPFALPSTISRFHGFPGPFNVFPRPNAHFFTAKSCFHGHILIPRPNRFFEAIWPNGLWPPFSRSNGPPGFASGLRSGLRLVRNHRDAFSWPGVSANLIDL